MSIKHFKVKIIPTVIIINVHINENIHSSLMLISHSNLVSALKRSDQRARVVVGLLDVAVQVCAVNIQKPTKLSSEPCKQDAPQEIRVTSIVVCGCAAFVPLLHPALSARRAVKFAGKCAARA